MNVPQPPIPEPSPLIQSQDEAALYLAQGNDLRTQLDAAIDLLVEHAGGDRAHWGTVIAARRMEKKI